MSILLFVISVLFFVILMLMLLSDVCVVLNVSCDGLFLFRIFCSCCLLIEMCLLFVEWVIIGWLVMCIVVLIMWFCMLFVFISVMFVKLDLSVF